MSGKSLIFGGAKLFKIAFHAARFPRHAHAPAVPDQLCEKIIHFSRGSTAIKSCSIFLGSELCVRSSRLESRITCVSTTTPAAMPNPLPSHHVCSLARHARQSQKLLHRFAELYRRIPRRFLACTMMDFVLLRKKPVGRMSCSISAGLA